MRVSALTGLAALIALTNTAHSWSELERYEVASNLGSVLGSEAACGISIKQDAVAGYIQQAVPADDMSFTSELNSTTDVMRYDLQAMSEAQKSAHCTQIRRVAQSYGFID